MKDNKNDITVIAEIGSVHDGSYGNAIKLIELAAKCGASAVKFQTHIAFAETLSDAPNPPYFKEESRNKQLRGWGGIKIKELMDENEDFE